MIDTRFETVIEDTDGLLSVVDVDAIGDLETLLMFLFARPVMVTEVWDDEGLTPSLDVILHGNDEAIGTVYDYPLSILDLARSCAETIVDLGPYTRGGDAMDAADVSVMNDGDLINALQRALGQVRLSNMLEEASDPMMLPPGDEPSEPYTVARGVCPSCGSDEVVHLVIGMPSGPDAGSDDPDWVNWVGCVHPGFDRECNSCGATWSARTENPSGPVRLLSQAGASFALLPAPNLVHFDHQRTHLVDIELLTPDRLVRYLGRPLSTDTIARLAETWMQAAHDERPEQSVATVQDEEAGLAVVVNHSTSFAVTMEFLVIADLDGDVPDQDGVEFDVARSGLIDAAHELESWLV